MNDKLTTIATAIQANLTDLNLFTVTTDAASQRIFIDFNLADTKFWVILTQRSVKTLFRVIVKVYPDGKASVSDEWREVVWSAGVPQLGASLHASFTKGTRVDYIKKVEYKFTGNGLEEAYSYAINTGTILGRVKQIVKSTGTTLKLDGATLAGLIVAGVTLFGLLIFGVLAATGVIKLQTTTSNQPSSNFSTDL